MKKLLVILILIFVCQGCATSSWFTTPKKAINPNKGGSFKSGNTMALMFMGVELLWIIGEGTYHAFQNADFTNEPEELQPSTPPHTHEGPCNLPCIPYWDDHL